jgi:hypothetical protein
MTMKIVVDLSSKFGPVRWQHYRPTCMAFSFSECHEIVQALNCQSPEYLYRAAARRMPSWVAGGAGLSIGAAISALNLDGQPDEVICPYAPSEPTETPPLLPTLPAASIHRAASVADHMSVQAVTRALQNNRPVGLLVRVTDTLVDTKTDTVAYSDIVPTDENHCLVAAGYGIHVVSNEQYFLIRNSWGPNWGANGSAWLSEKYLRNHGIAYFEVQ